MHLLVVAHGSRQAAANLEIRDLVKQMQLMTNRFSVIECAFLEIAEPSIEQGLQQLIARGALEIIVMPYFLSAGRHVTIDIPEQVQSMRDANPHVDIRIADYLGAAENIRQVLIDQACLAI
ncbi:MAG: cobalamin biosynthesis protein CbiX [Proteobacteria bacterium ST_bin11]|jgi:sirohydrochlorin ferrochelatase|nr:MAG: cobalamin biosynthesis protein CbiX [Proteobacteria bacterium ST_bin11]